MTNIKLICFDLDGVICDMCQIHKDSLNCALKEVAGFEIDDFSHENVYNGLPTKKKLEILVNKGDVKQEDCDLIWSRKQYFTKDAILSCVMPDLEKIRMHRLIKLMNIRSCCVTNSIAETTELMLRLSGQLEYLDFVINNESVRSPKPSPEGYILSFIKTGINPENVLIVEDSPKGIEAAKASCAHVWQVSGPNEVNWENLHDVLLKLK